MCPFMSICIRIIINFDGLKVILEGADVVGTEVVWTEFPILWSRCILRETEVYFAVILHLDKKCLVKMGQRVLYKRAKVSKPYPLPLFSKYEHCKT